MTPDSPHPPKSAWLRPQSWLLAGCMALIFFQFFLLSPAPLEQPSKVEHTVDQKFLMQLFGTDQKNRFGISDDVVPDYTIHGFHYVSSQGGKKQWRILAKVAHFYTSKNFIYGKDVKAYLYNPEGLPTLITGDEAGFTLKLRDLEMSGNVIARFPDGFKVESEQMKYQAATRDLVIPAGMEVHGGGFSAEEGRETNFTSLGLHYSMAKGEIHLPDDVEVTSRTKGGETTRIFSDSALIDRNKKVAYFQMMESRPPSERFALLFQPDLFVRGREMEFQYGRSKAGTKLNNVIATHDVYIEELEPASKSTPGPDSEADESDWTEAQEELTVLRYATCGRAEFDADRNLIVLSVLPQVYQDNDTVTGEVITIHRSQNVVEVERSNAYSPGK